MSFAALLLALTFVLLIYHGAVEAKRLEDGGEEPSIRPRGPMQHFTLGLGEFLKHFATRRDDPHPAKRRGEDIEMPGNLNHRQAAIILGVRENASVEEIKAAHRDAIRRNHPDRGGSQYLASQINQARDVLLAKKKR